MATDITETDISSISENTSNYALQLALKTMQERCQQLQKRLAAVEDENCSLRIKYNRDKIVQLDNNTNKPEVELLKDKIAVLAKQKSQLAQNVVMVAAENRNLWSRLSKLTDVNNSLGKQLLKISDTLNKHQLSDLNPIPTSTHLIRSKTFTQHAPRERMERNHDIDQPDSDIRSLEEISLKIMDRLLKEKADLEEQCAQMEEIQQDVEVDVNAIGYTYPESNEEDQQASLSELTKHSEKLNTLKNELILQQEKLRTYLDFIQKYTDNVQLCEKCNRRGTDVRDNVGDNSSGGDRVTTPEPTRQRRLCPICGKIFTTPEMSLLDLQYHVESHFIDEGSNLTDNFEIVSTLGV